MTMQASTPTNRCCKGQCVQYENLHGHTVRFHTTNCPMEKKQMTDSQPARGSLLPCPFCGGPAEAYSENAFPHHKRSACPKDGCPGTHVVASPEQWNTRVAGGGGEVVTDEAVEHAMEVLIENLDENRHGDVRLGEMYVEEADAYTVAYEIRGAWTVGALGDAMRAALVAALQVKP